MRIVVDVVAQLALGEAVGGEAVDDAVGVAELVVEVGADRRPAAACSRMSRTFLRTWYQMSGTSARRRRVLQVDEDRGPAGAGVALQVVEARRLLQLALEAVGDLLERVLDRGARPGGAHHHGLDREVGILAAAEPEVGGDARDHDHQHEVGHERAVPDRPFGEVEAVHQPSPSRRTFWPGRSICTPGGDHDVAGLEPVRDDDARGVVAHDVDVAQRHGLALAIDHPDGRASVRLGERARRHLDAVGRGRA